MPQEVFERLRAICADLFQVPGDKIQKDSSPETLEAWDSVQHLNLVLALEQEFGVAFDPEDIDHMKSIGAISELVEKKLA